MALSSYYSNYGQLDFSSSDLMMMPPSTIFKEENPFDFSSPTQLQTNHFSNYDNLFFDPVDTYLNDPNDYFLAQENYTQVAENPLFESFFTLEDYELSNKFLKRQKCYYEDDNCSYGNNNNNGPTGNYYYMKTPSFQCHDLKQAQLPSLFTPPQYFQEQSFSSIGNNTTKGCNSKERESSVTAQSIAARTRRKKISDKTVKLSKLIPGGSNKMNSTAEMLHAAFKYVKFMQAQVGILQTMSSFQEVHGSLDNEEKDEGNFRQNNLEELVTSGKIQDKLSSMEKCLVPIDFIKELAKDGSFNSVSDTSLNQLLVLD
ncbi:hypothetical protein LIER_40858 [Lithospermum erythrorhizon]|uniref:BHLH domain-containing protein n=1 Tax=Lithospermum erythrorhizon TaxID=34254 RepID=A0AAV3R0T8_LITER